MAATLTQERFTGPDWTFERKYDGIRLLAFRNGDDVRLYSRNRLLQNIPPVAAAIGALPARQLILDGEITWRERSLTYHVFDVLWIDGEDLMPRAIEERRARLSALPLRKPLERVALLDEAEPW